MNCYISRNYKNLTTAGNKAKSDIESIMSDIGFRNIGIRQTHYKNSAIAFLLNLVGVIKALLCLHKGDNLVIQYPLKKYFSLLCTIAHMRGAKVIVIIHDLGSFRRKKLTIREEINRFNVVDYIISHNESMKKWLIDNGCKTKIGVLEIFDYLSSGKSEEEPNMPSSYSIVYAGALRDRKNAFLYKVGDYSETLKFSLYGNGFEIDKAKNKSCFNYLGFIKSDDLISKVQGDFGLVWDGDSIEECSGDFGEYLKLNNPHKTSLYIRCGLPIIIWKEAALAKFVEENNIGFSISSLKELEDKASIITKNDYLEMKKNISEISIRLSKGYYVSKALNDAIKYFK